MLAYRPTKHVFVPFQSENWYKFCLFWSGIEYSFLGKCESVYSYRISRKVVGKSARDNPEWYCGWFLVHCSSKKFERMAREVMDVCLRVLKESKKVGSTRGGGGATPHMKGVGMLVRNFELNP